MKKSKWRELQERFMKLPLLGLFLTFLSASLFGLCNVIVKQVVRLLLLKLNLVLPG